MIGYNYHSATPGMALLTPSAQTQTLGSASGWRGSSIDSGATTAGSEAAAANVGKCAGAYRASASETVGTLVGPGVISAIKQFARSFFEAAI